MAVSASLAFLAPAAIDPELLAYSAGLFVLVGVGIWLAMKLRSTVRRDDAPEHSLAHYQKLFDEGLLDAQEFERIRALIRKRPPSPPTTS